MTAKKTTKAKTAPKAKAAAKPKAAPKEPRVKHAPEPLPEPNRQAKGWRNSQPIYED
ncbi:hypothetical protein [Parvibaculum sp.]|uniref:hypothetical protein n=1 Tax=Parvibaculum sp. TaxID=2024848 RepID=UPI00391AAC39